MRTITCRKCGETWPMSAIDGVVAEHNAIHPQDGLEAQEVYSDFSRYGCRAITGRPCHAAQVTEARQRAEAEWTWPS